MSLLAIRSLLPTMIFTNLLPYTSPPLPLHARYHRSGMSLKPNQQTQHLAAGAKKDATTWSPPTLVLAQRANRTTATAAGSMFPCFPTTIDRTAIVGCGEYAIVPTKDNCPTAPAFVGGGGGAGTAATLLTSVTIANEDGGCDDSTTIVLLTSIVTADKDGDGGGSTAVALLTSVTTGGPIATVTDAFATTASSVTTLSY